MDWFTIFFKIPAVLVGMWAGSIIVLTILTWALFVIYDVFNWMGKVIFNLFTEPHRSYHTPWGEEVDFGDWHRVQYYYNGDWSLFAPERYQQKINWQREGF